MQIKVGMQRQAISKFRYIEKLVRRIKYLHQNKENYDLQFDELLVIYSPLIKATTKNVYKKFPTEVTYAEIRSKVIQLIFMAVVRYDPDFQDGNIKIKDYDHVYFSKYLQKFIPWETMRLLKPTKVEHDDLIIDSRNVELDQEKVSKESIDKAIIHNALEHPISENFISLCRFAQKEVKNDLISDIMMLHYGYDFKNHEIAKILNISQVKVGSVILELKKFWIKHKELLIEGENNDL